MTHFFQRSALILLASTALGVSPALSRVHHGHKAPAASKAAADEARVSYVVKKGDTLEKIADKLGTTIPELLSANHLKKTSVLHPGDKLKGPVVEKPAAAKKSSTAKKKAAGSPTSYTVARGDTLFAIARRFGVSIEDLRKENHLSAHSQIRAGQELRLPGAGEAAGSEERADETSAAPARSAKARHGKAAASEEAGANDHAAGGKVITVEGARKTYRTRKGDTLGKVAARFGVSVSQLKADNGLKGSVLPRGKLLKGPRQHTQHAYVAQRGDTLASIAERFGVSVSSLSAENHVSRHATVRGGQKIVLPENYSDRDRDRAAARRAEPPPERPSRSSPRPAEPEPTSPALPSRPQPYTPSDTTPTRRTAPSIPSITPPPTDAQVSQMARGRFAWPLKGELLSDFGVKPTGQRNDGIDIQAEAGASVRSAADGDVVYAGDQVPGFGNLVLIKHADGWVTAYGHLSRIDVKMQQKVMQGQQIGQAGTSGGVTEPQVHFEVRYAPNPLERARPVDPKLVLPR